MAKKINIYLFYLYFVLTSSILIAQNEKCGTFRQVERHWKNKFSKVDKSVVSRPTLQKSILTVNSKIRIHFDTTGINQPAMVDVAGNRIPNSFQQFIDTLRTILDSVWNAEIETYHFNTPPADNGRGGGDEYDFYIMNFNDGTFGITNIEDDLPVGPSKTNQQYSTFIQIDNDFGIGYRTKGIPALMATCAHEFHHAIQVGGSGVWEDNYFYFYEICAEAMENTVFNDAKDYIFDVKTYFTNISSTPLFQPRSGFSTAGYERAILGMFLMKKYGTSIMKEIWEEMKTSRPVFALKNALELHLSTIEKEFVNFSVWNFYTNYRSSELKYFPDAKLFPLVNYSEIISLNNSSNVVQKTSQSFTSHFIKVSNQLDTVFFIISNTNFSDAQTNAGQTFAFQLKVSTSSVTDVSKVSNSIYAGFTVSDPQNWNYALSTDTTSIKKPAAFDEIVCFPNPYKPNESNLFFISLNEPPSFTGTVNMYIFSSSSELIFSGQPQLTNIFGKRFSIWNGKDNKGNSIPSGVYMYVLSKDTNILKGKFAVIR